MSGLVERVREKVRGADGPSQDNYQTSDKPGSRDQDLRTSRDPNKESRTDRMSSPTIPAWHIHKGANPKSTKELLETPFPQPPIDPRSADSTLRPMSGEQTLPHDHRYTRNTAANNMNQARTSEYTEDIPARSSSLQYQQPHAVTTDTAQQLDQRAPQTSVQGALPYPYTVPRRKESLSQSRALPRKSGSHERQRSTQYQREMQDGTAIDDGRYDNSSNLPLHISNTDLGMEVDQALASLSIDNERHQNSTQIGQTMTRSAIPAGGHSEHLRLPESFKVGHTETTTIDTEWKPAVTHETIRPQRTEVIQEAITRDIHIHHYYTYVQPITVTEILPAKHYRIDESTGRRYEIEEPAGWRMPQNLQPRSPDLAAIKGWERHYLVNEQYPRGIPEPPPTTKRRDYSSKGYVNGRAARAYS